VSRISRHKKDKEAERDFKNTSW